MRGLVVLGFALLLTGCPGAERPAEVPKFVKLPGAVEAWQPTAGDLHDFPLFPDQIVIPERIATFSRTVDDQFASLREFEFPRAGRHAVYGTSKQPIEVFVYHPVTSKDVKALRDTVFEIAQRASSGPQADRLEGSPTVWSYLSGQGPAYHFASKNDWLVVIRGLRDLPLEDFGRELLAMWPAAPRPADNAPVRLPGQKKGPGRTK